MVILKSISIEELANNILEVFNKKLPIKGGRLFRKNDYKDVFASIKKTKKELNWSPKYSLINGLSDLKKKWVLMKNNKEIPINKGNYSMETVERDEEYEKII